MARLTRLPQRSQRQWCCAWGGSSRKRSQEAHGLATQRLHGRSDGLPLLPAGCNHSHPPTHPPSHLAVEIHLSQHGVRGGDVVAARRALVVGQRGRVDALHDGLEGGAVPARVVVPDACSRRPGPGRQAGQGRGCCPARWGRHRQAAAASGGTGGRQQVLRRPLRALAAACSRCWCRPLAAQASSTRPQPASRAHAPPSMQWAWIISCRRTIFRSEEGRSCRGRGRSGVQVE